MRLLSATVRNYRIHRELTVDFDRARTLIGGPNESGKSTLIQAIHRGLFLKATVTGKTRNDMVSRRSPGQPEVQLRFQAEGAEYQLVKRFAGQNGTIQLTRVGGQTWQGEEAQARLAGLLGVAEPGRPTAGTLDQQWAHLWVWQGESGSDPSVDVAAEEAALLQQLQCVGGAVAMQSKLDGQVAARFAQVRDQIFTSGNAPKKGSDLQKAQADAEQAGVELTAAREKVEALGQAVKTYLQAASTIERTSSDLKLIAEEREGVDEKIAKASGLEQRETIQSSGLDSAEKDLASLESLEAKIADLRGSIGALETSLTPMKEAQDVLEAQFAERQKAARTAEQAHDGAQETTRTVRLRKELATAHVKRLDAQERCRQLDERHEHVQVLQNQLVALREEIAALPAIDGKGLRVLQELESRLGQASAALKAMATEVAVVATTEPVRVGEDELAAGDTRTVSDPTEVTVGDLLHLRIRPGGGNSLASAREEVRTLEASLRRTLDEHGLESIAHAAAAVAHRDGLETRRDAAETALKEWDPEDLAATRSRAKDEVTAAQAELRRRLEQVVGEEEPQTLAEAQAGLSSVETALEAAESEETVLKATRDTLRSQASELETQLLAARTDIFGGTQELGGLEAQERMLVADHGDDQTRSRALVKARKARDDAKAELDRIRASLEELQPKLLRQDSARLERAREVAEKQRQDAQMNQAVSRTLLHSEGTSDPQAALAQAEARSQAAGQHLESVSRRARAIVLLDDLFHREQRSLADQYSKPLADKITSYLQCLFGPEARAEVQFDDGFQSCRLVRPDQPGAEEFGDLSGGTREQVAAAVRLAVAELLCVDHDGCLPVVFDDSFAYSDPDRVRILQRMLDLGAAHGLQIIVLSCNPSDYASLGAHEITLS